MSENAYDSPHGLQTESNRSVAAALLGAGKSVSYAAEAISVSRATLYRWIQEPEFKALIASHRGVVLGEALGRLTELALSAVDVLARSLGSENESNRLRAATAILDRLMTIREATEVAERLAALEAKLEARP